jgi:hypothetical protein
MSNIFFRRLPYERNNSLLRAIAENKKTLPLGEGFSRDL